MKGFIILLDEVCAFTSNSSLELDNLLNNTTVPELQKYLNKIEDFA